MLDARMCLADIVLEVVHKMAAVAFHLLCAGDSAEHDLCKAALWERAVGDATDHLQAVLDNGEGPVVAIKDETRNVLARHVGELLLEDVLESGEDDAVGRGIVVKGGRTELDDAVALFGDGGPLFDHSLETQTMQ